MPSFPSTPKSISLYYSIRRTILASSRYLVADREDLDVVRGVPGASSLELVTTEVSSNLASGSVLGLAVVVGVDVKDNGSRVLDEALVAVVELESGVLFELHRVRSLPKMVTIVSGLLSERSTYEGAGLGSGGLVKDVVGVGAVASGVDVSGDTDNGGSESEDGSELHFDRVSKWFLSALLFFL